MRFEATKSDLIADARAALAAADRELRSNPRSHAAQRRQHPAPPAPQPQVAPQLQEEQLRVVDSIAEELTAINETALEVARLDMEAAINRYVTASSVYNRILAEMRQQLREAGGLSEEEITYRSETGRPGLRVKDIVRLQALPWQTVSQTALAALRTHAPVDHMSLEGPYDAEITQLLPGQADVTPPAAPTPVEAAPVEPAQVEAMPETTGAALERAEIEELFDEMIAPVLAFVRDQQGELAQLRARIEQQSGVMGLLREQVERQAVAAERLTAYFDALREAQSRLS